MNLIRSDDVFRFLADRAVVRGGQELRADGRVDDVPENVPHRLFRMVADLCDQIADQGLRNGTVHSIH